MNNKLPPLKEKDIEKQIVSVLQRVGALVIQTHGQIWNKVPPKAGISDLIACLDGKCIAIEVKRPGGKLTENQERFLHDVRAAGGIAFVAYDVVDVVKALGLKVRLMPMFGG